MPKFKIFCQRACTEVGPDPVIRVSDDRAFALGKLDAEPVILESDEVGLAMRMVHITIPGKKSFVVHPVE
jgi:hypothetical protein